MPHETTIPAGSVERPGVPLYALVMSGALRFHDGDAARPPDGEDHASD